MRGAVLACSFQMGHLAGCSFSMSVLFQALKWGGMSYIQDDQFLFAIFFYFTVSYLSVGHKCQSSQPCCKEQIKANSCPLNESLFVFCLFLSRDQTHLSNEKDRLGSSQGSFNQLPHSAFFFITFIIYFSYFMSPLHSVHHYAFF